MKQQSYANTSVDSAVCSSYRNGSEADSILAQGSKVFLCDADAEVMKPIHEKIE
jgi:hypothetical protein